MQIQMPYGWLAWALLLAREATAQGQSAEPFPEPLPVRPGADPREWMRLQHESATPAVALALLQFAETGSWPTGLSPLEKHSLQARLRRAGYLCACLARPETLGGELQVPHPEPTITTVQQVLQWLLIDVWQEGLWEWAVDADLSARQYPPAQ